LVVGRDWNAEVQHSESEGNRDGADRLPIGEDGELGSIRNLQLHVHCERLLRICFDQPDSCEPACGERFAVRSRRQLGPASAVRRCAIRDRKSRQARNQKAYEQSLHCYRPPTYGFGAQFLRNTRSMARVWPPIVWARTVPVPKPPRFLDRVGCASSPPTYLPTSRDAP